MIVVANKKRKMEKIQEEYPGAYILDITSSSPFEYGRLLSPFYPHKNIPIPGDSRGMTAYSVEGIWQGLKVFENAGIDMHSFRNDTMKDIKRTVRKFGRPLGHQNGVYSKELLNYLDAKRLIYAPAYKYVLENVPKVRAIVERIRQKAQESDIVLLDYNINPDNRDASKPLSHAELVKMYIEDRYPETDKDFRPWTPDELKELKKSSKRNTTTARVKVSASDLDKYKEDIVKILKKDERTASDIATMLGITVNSTLLKKYLEKFPNISIQRRKNRYIFSLKEQNEDSTLF
ncbi:MAG: hypothetical protein IKV91_06180 [Bacteroidales bacterium]|nr:hypothetical protein [Bacteroidales bacterium]